MKKVFILLAISGSLVACSNNEQSTTTTEDSTTMTTVTPAPMTGDTINTLATDTTVITDTLPQ